MRTLSPGSVTTPSSTPAALYSSDYVFCHSLTASGRHGVSTGLLISPNWKFSIFTLTHLSISSVELHAVTVGGRVCVWVCVRA